MRARIFQPPKTAMQSGWAKTQDWALEFVPTHGRKADPLTLIRRFPVLLSRTRAGTRKLSQYRPHPQTTAALAGTTQTAVAISRRLWVNET